MIGLRRESYGQLVEVLITARERYQKLVLGCGLIAPLSQEEDERSKDMLRPSVRGEKSSSGGGTFDRS